MNWPFNFGVEFEGYTEKEVPDRLEIVLDHTNETECWVRQKDNSIRGGGPNKLACEFASPILKSAASMEAFLEEITSGYGEWVVDDYCGFHVHIDARGLEYDSFRNLIALMAIIEPVLFATVSPSRWKPDATWEGYDKWFCQPMSLEMVTRMFSLDSISTLEDLKFVVYNNRDQNEFSKTAPQRYYGFNLHPFFYQGSVEFRYFDGANDIAYAKQCVELCQKIVQFAKSTSFEDILNLHRRMAECRGEFKSSAEMIQETLDLSFELIPIHSRVMSLFPHVDIPQVAATA